MVRKMLADLQPSRKIVRVERPNCGNLTIFYLLDEPFRKIVRVERPKLW